MVTAKIIYRIHVCKTCYLCYHQGTETHCPDKWFWMQDDRNLGNVEIYN